MHKVKQEWYGCLRLVGIKVTVFLLLHESFLWQIFFPLSFYSQLQCIDQPLESLWGFLLMLRRICTAVIVPVMQSPLCSAALIRWHFLWNLFEVQAVNLFSCRRFLVEGGGASALSCVTSSICSQQQDCRLVGWFLLYVHDSLLPSRWQWDTICWSVSGQKGCAVCYDPSSFTRSVHRLTSVRSMLTGLLATDFLVDDATCWNWVIYNKSTCFLTGSTFQGKSLQRCMKSIQHDSQHYAYS